LTADEEVKKFVGEYKPERYLLDYKKPFTLGAIDLQDYYFEHRLQLADAMRAATPIILDVAKDSSPYSAGNTDFTKNINLTTRKSR